MPRKTTRSYTGRQVDLEVLSHVESMLPKQKIVPDAHNTPRLVAGIEKAVQRHVKLFLTRFGSMKLEPDRGGTLLKEIREGRVQDLVVLEALCGAANAEAILLMRRDDNDTNTFGDIPDDERLAEVSVSNVELNPGAHTIKVELTYTTVAGDDYTFVVPVASV